MDTPSLDLPEPSNVMRTLAATLSNMPAQLFAVLDGALFDDLPGNLMREGISCRSLFLEHGDLEVERAGPWMVALDSEKTRAHIEALAVAHPCAVFWSCPAGETALWRHLRTLNEVLIPIEGSATETADQSAQYERVMFRHWDPNVLASVMPVLSVEQFARIFGPATYIVMNAPDYGGLGQIPLPDDIPAAPNGPLRLSPDQMEGLKEATAHSSRLRIARYLKRNIPPHFSGIDDEFLWGTTLASEASADELGIETERGRARWAYVMMLSDGKAADLKEVRSFIQNGEASPDTQVRALMRHTIDALRDGSAGVA